MLSADTEERVQVVTNLNMQPSHQYNPYHLSSVNHGYDENNRGVRQFDSSQSNTNTKNTDYYFYLRRISSFWYEYLPSLYKNYQDRTGRASSEQDRFAEGKNIFIITQVDTWHKSVVDKLIKFSLKYINFKTEHLFSN